MEDYLENDGFRQKPTWHERGQPPLDEVAVAWLMQRMNASAEEASKDWATHEAAIEEQTKLDLAAKKARDKAIMDAKHKANREAAMQRINKKRQAKAKEASSGSNCFISQYLPFPPSILSQCLTLNP